MENKDLILVILQKSGIVSENYNIGKFNNFKRYIIRQ